MGQKTSARASARARDKARLERAKARYDACLLAYLTKHRNYLRRVEFRNHALDPPDMLAIIKARLGDKRFRYNALTCARLATL